MEIKTNVVGRIYHPSKSSVAWMSGLISNLLIGKVETDIPKSIFHARQHINKVYHHSDVNQSDGVKVYELDVMVPWYSLMCTLEARSIFSVPKCCWRRVPSTSAKSPHKVNLNGRMLHIRIRCTNIIRESNIYELIEKEKSILMEIHTAYQKVIIRALQCPYSLSFLTAILPLPCRWRLYNKMIWKCYR